MNWSTFQQNIRKITNNDADVSIYYLNETATASIPTNPGTFCPVDIPAMYYFNTEPMLPYSGYVFASDNTKVKPLDLNAETFNTFTGAWDDWAPAEPYDTILVQYYSGKYPLKAIKELDATLPAGYFVSTHYGDWPSPEVFFVNKK